MRKYLTLVLAATSLAGCHHGGVKLSSGPRPAHVEPKTTSIYGNWVLATPSDSTAFAGASVVELDLQPGTFAITAAYPNHAPVTVRGTTTRNETGLLILTPDEHAAGLGTSGALVMSAGQPYSMQASAAGNTLVFAPPSENTGQPSSVWYKKAAAKAAGQATDTGAKRDSIR